jgi:predicted GNAT family acetyltransferase
MLAAMELRRFAEIDDFLEAAGPFLVEREAEHNLIFGVSATIRDTPEAYSGPPYMAVVERGARVVAAALQTPPFRLILSEVDDPAAYPLIAADVLDRDLPGVTGPVEPTLAFLEAWASLGGPPATLQMSDRSYRLTQVRPPRPVAGRMRPATIEDRPVVRDWIEAFMLEAFGVVDLGEVEANVDRWLAGRNRTLYLWEDGEVVSLTGVGGPTPHGIRIGPVYTPPAGRRRGYASALVAAVSQAELDAGRRFCFLFTDLANLTSNRIYQAIGYEPVRDFDLYGFDRP